MMTRSKRKPGRELSAAVDEVPLEPSSKRALLQVPSEKQELPKAAAPRLLEKIFPFDFASLTDESTDNYVNFYCPVNKTTFTKSKSELIAAGVTKLSVDVEHEVAHYRRPGAKDGNAGAFIDTFIDVILQRLKELDRIGMVFVLSSRELVSALGLDNAKELPIFGLIGLMLIRRAAYTVATLDADTPLLIKQLKFKLEHMRSVLVPLFGSAKSPTFASFMAAQQLITRLQIKSQLSQEDITTIRGISQMVSSRIKIDPQSARDAPDSLSDLVRYLLTWMTMSPPSSKETLDECTTWRDIVSSEFRKQFANAVATLKH